MRQLIAEQIAAVGDQKLLELRTGITMEATIEKFCLLKWAMHLNDISCGDQIASEAILNLLNL